jgi:Xaa-Pro aminopeptidase
VAVVTGEELIFFTDSRYEAVVASLQQTPARCPGLRLDIVKGSYDSALAAFLAGGPFGRVGFEAEHLSVARWRWLTASIPQAVSLVPVERLVEAERIVKDGYEIATLREAGRRLSSVADALPELLERGKSELVIAARIDVKIREAGFSRTAFETIVASGPNAALPHARPTERKLSEDDVVVLDFGGVYDSYCVDLTRMAVVGPPAERVRQVYDAVLLAHDRAIAAVAPGRSRFEIDQAARETLAGAGMGNAFGHGTGHGLGIEVHEDPRIVRRRPDVDARDEFVTAGMVFTIEPGAYFPGWGGVRIEDDVLVTGTGVERLTGASTGLLEID